MSEKVERKMLRNLSRAAEFTPTTVDKEKRSAELCWSVGSRVLRGGFFEEPFYEELSMDPSAIRLDRMNGGAAPLLKNHDQYELESVLGTVDKAWLDSGKGMAAVRFSSRDDVAPIFQDVVDGIIRNVSVGYRVYRYQDVSQPDDKFKVLRAIDWEPLEVSLVPVGADADAGVRSGAKQETPCEIICRAESAQGEIMEKDKNPNAADPALNKEEITRAATEAERVRSLEITKAVRKAGLPENLAEKMIADGVKLDEARAQIIDKLAERTEATKISGTNPAAVVTGGAPANQESRNRSIESAILHRYDMQKFKLEGDAREFRGMTLMEIARSVLEASGKSTRGMSRDEIAKRAFEGVSDFPAILANVANRTLRDQYQSAPQTFRPIVKVNMAPDFKQMSRTQLSDAPSLEIVGASGEVKRGALTDGKEVYQLATYAKIVPINRQAIINDDLSAFTRIPGLMGRAAADLESDTVWNIILNNAAMGDSVALFHATHKNLAGTGAAIATDKVGAARAAMKLQKNLQSRPINLLPKFLAVDPNNEYLAEQVVGPIVPNAASTFNPFMGKLTILSEPRLTVAAGAQPWYVFADPSQIDIIELSYLEGQEGVYLESKQGFDVDGVELKVRLDVAAKALDWRGMFKNPGV